MPATRRRAPVGKGQTYQGANPDRLIGVDNDVLGYKHLIEKTWPELTVAYDQIDGEWVIIEKCKDGQERLFCTEKVLGEHTLKRIRRGDQAQSDYTDFLDQMDKAEEERLKNLDRDFEEKIGDFGERFRHALKKDGVLDHEDIYGHRRNARGTQRTPSRS